MVYVTMNSNLNLVDRIETESTQFKLMLRFY